MANRINQKGFGAIEAIVLVVVLGVIGYLGYVYFAQMSKANDAVTTTESAKTTPNAASLVAELKAKLAKAYTLKDQQSNAPDLDKKIVTYIDGTTAPFWQAPGSDYYVSYEKGTSLFLTYASYAGTLEPPKALEVRGELSKDILAIFEKFGLKKATDSSYGEYVQPYTSDAVVCTSDIDIANPAGNLSVNCGDMLKFVETAKTAKPFIDAIRKTSPEYTSEPSLAITISEIKKGANGYEQATAGIGDVKAQVGGYAALFYRAEGGEWQYWKGTQQIIPCIDYNTEALKNAFKGEDCYIDGQDELGTV